MPLVSHSLPLQMLNGVSYQKCTVLVAFGFPGFVFSIVLFLNFFLWGKGSSNAIPFTSMFTVLLIWFAVSVPLVFMGAYNGFKKDKITFPVSFARTRFCCCCGTRSL